MAVAFIHLSDIHFGQERGGRVITHNDVRDRLVDDVAEVVKLLQHGRANGIIVSGDIAFAGNAPEYAEAGRWLDRVAAAAGCPITEVQVVPGNHDINRAGISRSSEWMLSQIADGGEVALDSFLEDEIDREVLYRRFQAYREFAEAYDCPLDREGGAAGHKIVELAPGRTLRFIGLNSALCCGRQDEKGKLLLGARQRVLPRNGGEELVVLCHHPLPWLRDSDEARRYVRSRARVFISGHEHSPDIGVDPVQHGCDLLIIESGAAVPPLEDEKFTFTYNALEFDWDSESDALAVVVYPRIWSPNATAFDSNKTRFGADKVQYSLGCPNFRSGSRRLEKPPSAARTVVDVPRDYAASTQHADAGPSLETEPMDEQFPYLLLRFFRDLTAAQRLSILVRLGALPQDWNGPLTHSMERRAVDALKASQKLGDLAREIETTLEPTEDGDAD